MESKSVPAYVTADEDGLRHWKTARRFYRLIGYRLAWLHETTPRRQAAALLGAVHDASAEGLDPAAYDVRALEILKGQPSLNPFRRVTIDPSQAVDLDVRLTYTFLGYASHVLAGRVDPEDLDPHWVARARRDLPNILKQALEQDRIDETLSALAPQHPQYVALRQALVRYREIARLGGWPQVPLDLRVKPPGADPRLRLVVQRLAATGDLGESLAVRARDEHADVPAFDDALVAALKRFELRHGLKADGILDKETLAAMNVPVGARIRQMELNLERWRWLPETLGQRHIVVNIPTFQLEAFDGGAPSLTMRVVVGKAEATPTPIFSDEMTTVVFSPHWHVPASIATTETLPAVLEDPGYLERNNLEILRGSEVVDPATIDWQTIGWEAEPFDYQFRQRPGTSNSLGLVKFLFPNQFNVYLHDTPADALFARLERDFSHGCIRVEKPVELAQWVLRDNADWTPDRIRAAMHAGTERAVALRQPIPVYLMYLTTWVGRDGVTQFRDDIYGHDERQARLLRAQLRSQRSTGG